MDRLTFEGFREHFERVNGLEERLNDSGSKLAEQKEITSRILKLDPQNKGILADINTFHEVVEQYSTAVREFINYVATSPVDLGINTTPYQIEVTSDVFPADNLEGAQMLGQLVKMLYLISHKCSFKGEGVLNWVKGRSLADYHVSKENLAAQLAFNKFNPSLDESPLINGIDGSYTLVVEGGHLSLEEDLHGCPRELVDKNYGDGLKLLLSLQKGTSAIVNIQYVPPTNVPPVPAQ